MQFLHKCFYKGYKLLCFGVHANHSTVGSEEASREASHPCGARGCKPGRCGGSGQGTGQQPQKSKGEVPQEEEGTISSLQAFFSFIFPLQTPLSLG